MFIPTSAWLNMCIVAILCVSLCPLEIIPLGFSTIAKGAALLHQEGAREVYACSTYAVFSPPAIERLSSGLFQEVIITNTIPVLEQNYFPQLMVLSVANLLDQQGTSPYSSKSTFLQILMMTNQSIMLMWGPSFSS